MKSYIALILLLFLCISCSTDEKPVQYELMTTIDPEESGTVNPDTGEFDSGTEISLTATPSEGYVFKNWSGEVPSTENPLTLTINKDERITAVFEKSDADGDGVPDDEDECADTTASESADAQGCGDSQKDSDGDGVNDNLDQCADTVSDEIVDSNGCPETSNDSGGDVTNDEDTEGGDDDENDDSTEEEEAVEADSDSDGVTDTDDNCPDTPNSETVDVQGCGESQKDTDGDGVFDDVDNCQDTPDSETADAEGCGESQKDTDGDGVFDNEDTCVDTPGGEIADDIGCSKSQKDTDGDGIFDYFDECPESKEGDVVNEKGCDAALKTYVPDDKFEQYLIDSGYDDVLDDYVITSNIENIQSLTLDIDTSQSPIDFTGLEDFISLNDLVLGFMSLDENFNLSNYKNLKSLELYESSVSLLLIDERSNLETLTSTSGIGVLRITNNNSLTKIYLEDAYDSSITISGNSKLSSIYVFDGDVGNIVITDNPSLKSISFEDIAMDNINFSNNPQLERFSLKIRDEADIPLDFSSYPILKDIYVRHEGQFSAINVTNNVLLEKLEVYGIGITSLNVSNNKLLKTLSVPLNDLTSLDLSNNDILTNFNTDYPIEGLKCIQVNEEQLNNIPEGWNKSPDANYSTNCSK